MTTSEITSSALRCPNCSALRPADARWCSQCYVRFDAPAADEPGQSVAAASVPSASSTAEGDQASVVSVRKHSSGNDGTALPLVGETTEWDLRHRQAGLELDEATRAARLDEAMAAFSAGDGSLSPTTRRLAQFTANPAGKLIVITCGGTLFLGLGMLAIVLAGKFL